MKGLRAWVIIFSVALLVFISVIQAFAAHPGTVRIIVNHQGDGRYYGSGTILDGKRGLILTCAHVVRHYEKRNLTVEVFGRDDRRLAIAYGRPVAIDKQHDVAIVMISPNLTHIQSFVADPNIKLNVGDNVRLAGGAGGGIPQIWSARISGVDRYIGGSIETSNVVPQGVSGGGVYNYRGRLIGVISATDPVDKTGFHIPIKHAYKLVNEVAIKFGWRNYRCGPVG